MLITRDQRRWSIATAAATALLGAAYVVSLRTAPYGATGGSWAGLAFGVAGTACMVVAGLLSARKAVRTWRVGSARHWMRMHVWLGLLAVPCIWFHSGFTLGGSLTTMLMGVFYTVIASGLVGLTLQQFVPTAMTRRVPLETLLSQMEHVRVALAVDAYEVVAAITGAVTEADVEQHALDAEAAAGASSWKTVVRQPPAKVPEPESVELKAFYIAAVRPYLHAAAGAPPPDLQPLLAAAPESWRAKLERLQSICEEARQLRVQRRLHALLHSWLFVHAPLSLALFVLVAVHIVFALRY